MIQVLTYFNMSYILCVLTVMTVDWSRPAYQSVPMVVPCTGQDHVLRLELVTVPTPSEYEELQRVMAAAMQKQGDLKVLQDLEASATFIGPRMYGYHYAPMFSDNQKVLSQNNTVRLISVTELIDNGSLGREDHLYNRLSDSNKKDQLMKPVYKVVPTSNVETSVTTESPFANVRYPIRTRRAADVNTKVDARFDIESKRKNEKHGSDNSDSKQLTTGGGYGSQTCTNAIFTAWNNSTFDSGKCGCDCPACPSCKTESFMSMTERANKERQSIQEKLYVCQEKLLGQHRHPSGIDGGTQVTKCSNSEVKRLKAETRSLRARIRRMTSTKAPSSPLPTVSTLSSSMETVGSALVEGVVQYAASRSQSRSGGNRVGASGESNSAVATRNVRPSKSTSTTSSNQSVINRRTRPSKIPVSSKSRTQVSRSQRKPPRKQRRGRRSLDRMQQVETQIITGTGKSHPWSSKSETVVSSPFHSSSSKSKLRTGNSISILIPRVKEVRSSQAVLYNPTHPRGIDRERAERTRKRQRGRRDAYDSSFIGSSNQAEITAFEHANFKGSTENRYDNSSNVKVFRPIISPKINVNSRGKNETLITKSENGNDIRITHSSPCSCEDDLGVIMTAVWTQMVLTVILTLSLALHYHLLRRVSHQKKKDLDVVRMQAHTVYRQNRNSQLYVGDGGRTKTISTPNCRTNQIRYQPDSN